MHTITLIYFCFCIPSIYLPCCSQHIVFCIKLTCKIDMIYICIIICQVFIPLIKIKYKLHQIIVPAVNSCCTIIGTKSISCRNFKTNKHNFCIWV